MNVAANVSGLVPTYERAADLDRMLASLLAGEAVPGEVVVVDASARGDTAVVVSAWAARAPAVRFVYERAAPGRPRQRNRTLELARGELLLFLEDDVVYEPAFLRELLRALEDAAVAAATGLLTNQRRHGVLLRAAQAAFLQVRYAPRAYYQRSALPAYLYRPAAPAPAEPLSGGLALVRRAALGPFRFDERITYFDDDDLSLALARGGYRAVQWPAARCEHRAAAGGRLPYAKLTRRRVYEQYLLHNRYFKRAPINAAAYYYSVLGAAVIAAARFKPRLWLATMLGLWDVVRPGRGGPRDAAEMKAE